MSYMRDRKDKTDLFSERLLSPWSPLYAGSAVYTGAARWLIEAISCYLQRICPDFTSRDGADSGGGNAGAAGGGSSKKVGQ